MPVPTLALGIALFFSPKAPSPLQHFVPVPVSRFPKPVFMREFCSDEPDNPQDCWNYFRGAGGVWAADLDGDGVDELMVEPRGGWEGSGGPWYFLYQKRGNDWVPLQHPDEDGGAGWQTLNPRFDVLPKEHVGYHDLRVDTDACLKWNGVEYVPYDVDDYHQLLPDWFDADDNHDAEILWEIRYAGQKTIQFEPQWFPLGKQDFQKMDRPLPKSLKTYPRFASTTLADPQEHIRWVSLLKGGVWGVRANRAFLLAPNLSYLGMSVFRIEGDWLLAYSDPGADDADSVSGHEIQPNIRYNRRTHELQIRDDGDQE